MQRIVTSIGGITDWFSISYGRRENDVGSFSVTLPPYYAATDFQRFNQLDISRSINGGILAPDLRNDIWLITKASKQWDRERGYFTVVEGVDAMELLRTRRVMYYDKTSYANKTGLAANVMAAFIDQNLGTAALDGSRNGVFTGTTTGIGGTISINASTQDLLSVMKSCAAASYAETGTPLLFNVRGTGPFVLNIYENFSGGDSSIYGFSFNQSNSKVTVGYDYSSVQTQVYVGSQGDDKSRIIALVDSGVGSGTRRSEGFTNNNQSWVAEELYSAGRKILRANSTRSVLQVEVMPNDNCLHGIHYTFGDRVLIGNGEVGTVCRISGMTVSRSGNSDEKVQLVLTGIDYPPGASGSIVSNSLLGA